MMSIRKGAHQAPLKWVEVNIESLLFVLGEFEVVAVVAHGFTLRMLAVALHAGDIHAVMKVVVRILPFLVVFSSRGLDEFFGVMAFHTGIVCREIHRFFSRVTGRAVVVVVKLFVVIAPLDIAEFFKCRFGQASCGD